MFLDLDRFNIINQTIRHTFGDIVLKRFSKRLSKFTGEDDMICHYGGDEFILHGSKKSELSAKDLTGQTFAPLTVIKFN